MIDVSIILSISKILKSKHPDINIVFYDEIFSSLHNINIGILLAIIKGYSQNLNSKILLMNHSYVSPNYIDSLVELENNNSFTTAVVKYVL
jgi:hypothetical protein